MPRSQDEIVDRPENDGNDGPNAPNVPEKMQGRPRLHQEPLAWHSRVEHDDHGLDGIGIAMVP